MVAQKNIFSRIDFLVRVINFSHRENLFDDFDEMHVSPSPPLETEIADGIGSNEVLQSLLKEWKRRLKVDAISGENNVRMSWQIGGNWLSPVVDCRFDLSFQIIEGYVFLHEHKHRVLVRNP